jgi:hypothetical protein
VFFDYSAERGCEHSVAMSSASSGGRMFHDAFDAAWVQRARHDGEPTVRARLRLRFMVAQCLAALLFLGVIHEEVAHDPLVRDELWKLLKDAHYGHADMEEAMFIVRGANGVLSFVRWKPAHVARQAKWNAPMPHGAIAIAHTHPNSMPRPSLNDIRTALRSNLPVYVVTRTRITKTAHGETSLVWKGEWRLGE